MITIPIQLKLPPKSKIFNESFLKYTFNDKEYDLLTEYRTRTLVFYGGGGSGKSKFVAQRTILKCCTMDNRKVLVLRNVLATVRDSVFAEFKKVLSEWKISHVSDIRETFMMITLPNGSEILFKGYDDEEKIKSLEGLTDIIVDEATEITKEKYDQLHLRIRNRRAGFNQLIVLFNPIGKDNWVFPTFFEGDSPRNCIIHHSYYMGNKFLPPEYVEFLEDMKTNNYRKYLIYALGQFASLSKTIYENYEEFEFDEYALRKSGITCYFGLDYGYTNDPTSFVKVYCDDENKILYIADELYEKSMLNTDISDWIFKRGYSKELITADSAEPKSNEQLRKEGIRNIKGSRKGRDSVAHGIAYIQEYKILVHPRCPNTLLELSNYCWLQDKKTGEYKNVPSQTYNHIMDALRYALESKIRKGRVKTMNKRLFGF